MSKEKKPNTITIDLDVWTTIAQKAEMEGITLNAMTQRLFKSRKGIGQHVVEFWDIPQLKLTLVKK